MPKNSITNIRIGQTYGRWTVVAYVGRIGPVSQQGYFCRCSCGTERNVIAISLVRAGSPTRSCGCLNRDRLKELSDRAPKHAKNHSGEYHSWVSMTQRCTNPNNQNYSYYGGRGIRVCERWRHSFENFLADMGKRPSPTHSIDRFPDKNGNYERGNCRWATKQEQSSNTRRCKYITINGRTQTIADWVRECGVSPERTVHDRITKGMDPWAALTTPSKPHVRRLTPDDVVWIRQQAQDRTMSKQNMAKRFNVSETTIYDAVQRKTFKYVP